MPLRSVLTRPMVLWISFILMCLSFAAITASTAYWEMELLDGKILPDDTFYTVSCYTIGKKEVHLWITAVLDVIFPISGNALFAGLIWKGFSTRWHWLAIIPLIAVTCDLAEGVVQLIILQRSFIVLPEGQQSLLLFGKAVLTSLKFLAWLIAAILGALAFFSSKRHMTGLDAP